MNNQFSLYTVGYLLQSFKIQGYQVLIYIQFSLKVDCFLSKDSKLKLINFKVFNLSLETKYLSICIYLFLFEQLNFFIIKPESFLTII